MPIFTLRLFHSIFALIVLGDLLGRILQNVWLDYLFKPLIMLSLGIFYHAQTPQKGTLERTVLWAIFFAWLGDVFLMFTDKGALFFPLGLVGFLISHIFYIVAYRLSFSQNPYSLIAEKKWLILPFALLGIGVYAFLFDKLGVLQIPVLLYTLVLTNMSIFALNRFRKVPTASFQLVFAGSLCFLVSDMCLAINMFAVPIPLAGLLVMSTYISAQYLIVRGILVK